MKRRDLMRLLGEYAKAIGQEMQFIEGGSHTRITIGDRRTVVPRHAEINELTARAILKQMGAI